MNRVIVGIVIVQCVILLPVIARAGGEVGFELEFSTQTPLIREMCAKDFAREEISEDRDFLRALKGGFVQVQSFGAVSDGQRSYCVRSVRLNFPTEEIYRAFIMDMASCPNYPSESNADYNFQKAVFEAATSGNDERIVRLLLSRDGRCEAESMKLIYRELRENPRLFLSVFGSLSAKQQVVVVDSMYDLNLSVSAQSFSAESLGYISEELKGVARRYNIMMSKAAGVESDR